MCQAITFKMYLATGPYTGPDHHGFHVSVAQAYTQVHHGVHKFNFINAPGRKKTTTKLTTLIILIKTNKYVTVYFVYISYNTVFKDFLRFKLLIVYFKYVKAVYIP